MKKISVLIILLLNIQWLLAQCSYIASFQTDLYGGPSKTINAGSKLFFSAYDTIHGREIWCTDGSAAGTFMVKDINPGIVSGINYDYFELTSYDLDGVIYFRGDDGITGSELWRSDGTAAGTYLVKDISPGGFGSSAGYFTSIDSILYFTANTGTSLWRSDGTAAGTYSLHSFSIVTNLAVYNGKLYFSADNSNSGQELWKSDGTPGGTFLLKDINGVFGASLPCNFHAVSNALYFMAVTADGWELWKTTGTQASTVMVKDINPGGGNGVMSTYSDVKTASIGNIIYFRADDGVNGFQLWKSDGTNSGTVRLTNLVNGVDAYCPFPVVDGKVLVNNYALQHWWQYDPVADSASETHYPFYYYFNTYTNRFTFVGSQYLYADKDTVYGCEIWQSDGTINGKRKIQETYLTDNWNTATIQGFDIMFGVLGNNLLFSLARNPYNREIPLFIYDTSNPNTCFPPSVIVPVPVADTAVHFVWNRIENTTAYEFQYREAGTTAWNTSNTSLSYWQLNNLAAATDYEYQLRAYCSNSWTGWSDISIYNTAFTQNDYIINILAERSENSTTERIYWLKTPQIPSIQIRYRPYGTTTWMSTNNATGYKKITGLQPNTFYEYQVRITGDTWPTFYNYFVTPDIGTFVTENEPVVFEIKIYPNPANGIINILGKGRDAVELEITDHTGRVLRSEKLRGTQIDVSRFSAGVYFLSFKTSVHTTVKKIILQ